MLLEREGECEQMLPWGRVSSCERNRLVVISTCMSCLTRGPEPNTEDCSSELTCYYIGEKVLMQRFGRLRKTQAWCAAEHGWVHLKMQARCPKILQFSALAGRANAIHNLARIAQCDFA